MLLFFSPLFIKPVFPVPRHASFSCLFNEQSLYFLFNCPIYNLKETLFYLDQKTKTLYIQKQKKKNKGPVIADDLILLICLIKYVYSTAIINLPKKENKASCCCKQHVSISL